MNIELMSAQADELDRQLTIGDLAERTGLSPATLRMWEQRHGFPRPQRLDSGHRRYLEADVEAVAHVVRRRDAGVRLDVAIADALAQASPDCRRCTPSCAASTRTYRCSGCTSAPFSHCRGRSRTSSAPRPSRRSSSAPSSRTATTPQRDPGGTSSRWSPGPPSPSPSSPSWTARRSSAPGRAQARSSCRCNRRSPSLASGRSSATRWSCPSALTAWELPGQGDVPDRERIFESILTVDPDAVRDAARLCAGVAQRAGAAEAAHDALRPRRPADARAADLGAVSAMLGRVLSYVDQFGAS